MRTSLAKPPKQATLTPEAPYLEVARRFGLRVGSPLEFLDNCLFIPRFDRAVGPDGLVRHGLESLCSAAEISEFGKRGDHGLFCSVLAKYATDPKTEIIEYLRRDILNAALRNTDNHGRNTAFLKPAYGTVALSPLYDFAPMFLDPEGIPRSSRWLGDGLEPTGGRPAWGKIAETLAPVCDPKELRDLLAVAAEAVRKLPETMRDCGVEDRVINGVTQRCAEIAEDLLDAKSKE